MSGFVLLVPYRPQICRQLFPRIQSFVDGKAQYSKKCQQRLASYPEVHVSACPTKTRPRDRLNRSLRSLVSAGLLALGPSSSESSSTTTTSAGGLGRWWIGLHRKAEPVESVYASHEGQHSISASMMQFPWVFRTEKTQCSSTRRETSFEFHWYLALGKYRE